MGNGQVNFAHTGCSRQTPALHEHFARPIWLAYEGVARGVCQFIGQNKVWEGDGWVWGEGKPSPPLLWEKCGPSHTLPPCLPLDSLLQPDSLCVCVVLEGDFITTNRFRVMDGVLTGGNIAWLDWDLQSHSHNLFCCVFFLKNK